MLSACVPSSNTPASAPAPVAPPAAAPAVIRVATLTLESGAAAMTLAYGMLGASARIPEIASSPIRA